MKKNVKEFKEWFKYMRENNRLEKEEFDGYEIMFLDGLYLIKKGVLNTLFSLAYLAVVAGAKVFKK